MERLSYTVFKLGISLCLLIGALCFGRDAGAESLQSALISAYRSNPSLNAQRAATRAVDENVPQALSGYRPRITVTASGGQQSLSTTAKTFDPIVPYVTLSGYNSPFSVGLTITQNLFNGFQTANRTRQAEQGVLAARAKLDATKQDVLLNAVTAYINLMRDRAILALQVRNVQVLQEQLRQTHDRFRVGEVTRTDVAQSESRLAAGRSQVLSAEAAVKASAAVYRQVIGHEPGKLNPASAVDRFSPSNLAGAVALGIAQNPAVTAAEFNVDTALLQVKIAEGGLLPSVSVQGTVQNSWLSPGSLSTMKSFNAAVLGTVSVPVYQGGSEYSLVRQAKETAEQRRLELATARDQARQTVVQSWSVLQAAKGTIRAVQVQVKAAEAALNGVREEARVGQRTTLDVLNAQQELVNARVSLVSAQRDRVVASYTFLAAVGRLSPRVLGLRVPLYQPQVHYEQVRDAWAGTRTPGGS